MDGGNAFWTGHAGAVTLTHLGDKPPDHDHPLISPRLFEMKDTTALAVDPRDRALWGFTATEALRYSLQGELRRFPLPFRGRVIAASIDGEGAAWVGDESHLARIAPELPGRSRRDFGARVMVDSDFLPTRVTVDRMDGAAGTEYLVTNSHSGMAFLFTGGQKHERARAEESPEWRRAHRAAPGTGTVDLGGYAPLGAGAAQPRVRARSRTPARPCSTPAPGCRRCR